MANMVIFSAKLVTYLMSGSRHVPLTHASSNMLACNAWHRPGEPTGPCHSMLPCSAMLAETVHSVVDTFNQARAYD